MYKLRYHDQGRGFMTLLHKAGCSGYSTSRNSCWTERILANNLSQYTPLCQYRTGSLSTLLVIVVLCVPPHFSLVILLSLFLFFFSFYSHNKYIAKWNIFLDLPIFCAWRKLRQSCKSIYKMFAPGSIFRGRPNSFHVFNNGRTSE